MQILGIIGILVGITLFIVGRSLPKYIPPDYNEADKGDIEKVLTNTGKILGVAGMVFAAAGLVLIIIGIF